MDHSDITRRLFGKNMLMGAAALSVAAQSLAQNHKKIPIALQLYTVRDLSKDDFRGTIEKVAKLGYDAVEFAGYGDLTGKEVNKLLRDLGLQCAGTHEGFAPNLTDSLDKTIEFNLEIGNAYIVCPSMPGEFRNKGADGIKTFAEMMNKIGAQVRKAGMHFCYHNHAFEFEKAGEQTIYEILMKNTDKKLVGAEVDLYWVKKGGADPVAFLKKYAGRCPMLHMKDMTAGADATFAPVGTGILDFKAIIKQAKANKTVWYIVEQDRTEGPVLEAIETSVRNLRKLLAD